jgi:hypothetical protein
MTHHDDLDAATQAAWTAFRQRVADHLAGLDDDDVLVVAWADASDPGVPLVEVTALGDGLLLLESGPEVQLAAGADEVAVHAVHLLRETYAVPHPAFLDADGLEVDPTVEARRAAGTGSALGDLEPEGLPRSRDHLVAMVDAAMTEVFPELKHDRDGDIPIVCGSSVAYVRVLTDRPSVELFAEIVIGPDAPGAADRLDHELRLLNDLHPLWKFAHDGERVRMVHEMPADPFVAAFLRRLVRRFVDEVDQIAAGLVVRVGGRLFLEPEPAEDDRDLVLTGLIELLHLGRVRATTVAGLFDHDRLEIIRQIVRIRRGEQSCAGHDEEVVLEALRKALRVVADGEAPAQAVPHARRSVQEPLLDGDEALDLGWSA